MQNKLDVTARFSILPDRLKLSLEWIGLLVILSCLSILVAHYLASFFQPVRWPTKWYFYVSLILALASRKWSTFSVLFALPLLPELHIQAQHVLHPSVKYFVGYPGLDVIAGFAIGQWFRLKIIERSPIQLSDMRPPWPLGLLLLVLTISTSVAIARNLSQTSELFSLAELFNKLLTFKLLSRGDNYHPLADLLVFGSCGLFIISLLYSLRLSTEKDEIIFKPILGGLLVSAYLGIYQAFTRFGLPENTYSYRPENFGYGAQGFQPDLHAFAGHMLLGAVGLFGFIQSIKSNALRHFSLFVVISCWIALILSKSRASLVFGVCITVIFLVWIFTQWSQSLFTKILTILGFVTTILFLLVLTDNYRWIIDLLIAIKDVDSTDVKALNTLSRDRLELHGAAIRMGSSFPIFGIGLGNFFRLSSIVDFSGSPYMLSQGGENAHNYFLQTFAEVGLVGAFCFLLIFLVPFYQYKQQKYLTPVLFAIIAIFAGNIYSHSLLIRENLLLLSAFLCLLIVNSVHQSLGSANNSVPYRGTDTIKKVILAVVASLALFLSTVEVITSFDRYPFDLRSSCCSQLRSH
jgi:O-antigen ligase